MNPLALVLGGAAAGLAVFAASKASAKTNGTPPPSTSTTINVKEAQGLLVRLGAKLAIDGKFGPQTAQAWVAAAKARDLQWSIIGPTGGKTAEVNEKTAEALVMAAAAAKPVTPVKPTPVKPKPVTPVKPTPAPDLEADRQAALQAAKEAKAREERQLQEEKAKDLPRHENINNAISRLDFVTPKTPAGVRKSVTDLVNHWLDQFWDKGKRDEPAKLDAYAQWYTRAWRLVPPAVQAKAVHPRTIDPTFTEVSAKTMVASTKDVQTVLRLLGSTIAADGKFGPATQKAWESAASSRQLAPHISKSGSLAVNVYKTTLDKLTTEAKARKASASPATPPAPAPAAKTMVAPTKDVQNMLRALGSTIAADGKFGPNTQRAWETAAAARQLAPQISKSGASAVAVNQATLQRLTSDAQAAKASKAPAAAAPANAETIVVPTLRAQEILTRHGATLKHDGIWGPNTRTAWEKLATTHHVSSRFEKASADGRQTRVDAQSLRKLDGLAPSSAGAQGPVGYDRVKAKTRAKEVATKLRQQGKAYDKRYLAAWQTQAGLGADGLYGPLTRNALVYYGATDAPAAYVQGANRPYTPPA